MKRLVLPALFLCASHVHAAMAIDGWYSSVFGGYSYVPNNLSKINNNLSYTDANYNSGFNAGARLGYKSTPMRYEGEISYISSKIASLKINGAKTSNVRGDTSATLLMLNAYYDFPEFVGSLVPYANLGLGYAFVNTNMTPYESTVDATQLKGSNGVFAYQAGVGLNYDFAESYGLNIGYRFVATEQVKALGKIYEANLLSVGATYRFDEASYK